MSTYERARLADYFRKFQDREAFDRLKSIFLDKYKIVVSDSNRPLLLQVAIKIINEIKGGAIASEKVYSRDDFKDDKIKYSGEKYKIKTRRLLGELRQCLELEEKTHPPLRRTVLDACDFLDSYVKPNQSLRLKLPTHSTFSSESEESDSSSASEMGSPSSKNVSISVKKKKQTTSRLTGEMSREDSQREKKILYKRSTRESKSNAVKNIQEWIIKNDPDFDIESLKSTKVDEVFQPCFIERKLCSYKWSGDKKKVVDKCEGLLKELAQLLYTIDISNRIDEIEAFVRRSSDLSILSPVNKQTFDVLIALKRQIKKMASGQESIIKNKTFINNLYSKATSLMEPSLSKKEKNKICQNLEMLGLKSESNTKKDKSPSCTVGVATGHKYDFQKNNTGEPS